MEITITPAQKKFLLGAFSLSAIITSTWVAEGRGGGRLLEKWFGQCDSSTEILCRSLVGTAGFAVSLVAACWLAKDFIPIQNLAYDDGVRSHKVSIAANSPFFGSNEPDNSASR